MKVRSWTTKPRLVQVLAVGAGASLLLSGCGEAGVAARVGDTVIREADAQKSAQQINDAFQPQQPLSTRDVVFNLAVAPAALKVAEESGAPQTESAAKAQFAAAYAQPGRTGTDDEIPIPTETTVQLLRANSALQAMTPADQAKVTEAVLKESIETNPRYGSLDSGTMSLVMTRPNWISADPGSAALAPEQLAP